MNDTSTMVAPGTETATSFSAKMSSRVYRVYARRSHLFFVVLAEGLSANPETLTVHFGLLGLLIQSSMKKRAKKKEAASVERMDQIDPEQLLAEHKKNFKVHASEIRESSIEPRPAFTFDGHQVGYLKLMLRDGRKMKILFLTNEEMTAALEGLSGFFNGDLKVNVQWNEKKKRFDKKKA